MRKLLVMAALVTAALLAAPVAAGTAPAIEWDHLYGGDQNDYGLSVKQTADGGYIVVGNTTSSRSGTVAGENHGGSDIWLLKLDPAGAIEGKRLLGGSGDEEAFDVEQTADGGYVVVGYSTSSTSGDVTGANHGPEGTSDIWVVKTDANGTIQKQMLLGGEGDDVGQSIEQTRDGGYVIAGSTDSETVGDPPVETYGDSDGWVIRLDAAGNVVWQKPLGSYSFERFRAVRQTADGGYVVVGDSQSHAIWENGMNEFNHGGTDVWVVKMAPDGTVQKHDLLGGDGTDRGYDVLQTADGGYVLVGESRSSESDDVTDVNHGDSDIWVVKIDAAGAILTQRLLGGIGYESPLAVQQTADGGYLVFGEASSASITEGDTTETRHGGLGTDFWVVRLGPGGMTRWHDLLGGSSFDNGGYAVQTDDGGYVLVGLSMSSASGDVTDTNHGRADYWVVKLHSEAPAVLAVPPSTLLPTDTDGDGLFDDVNGNGRADFADVVLYFNQLGWIAANEPVSAFDYNGNGRVDFADAVWLFANL